MKRGAENRDEVIGADDSSAARRGRFPRVLLHSLGVVVAILLGLFLLHFFRPIEDIILDERIDWVLEDCVWQAQDNYVLVFSGDKHTGFCLRFDAGDLYGERGCFLRKGKTPIEKTDLAVDQRIIPVVPESHLEDAVLRILGQSLREELRNPYSQTMAERVGALLVVSTRLKLPQLQFGEAGRISFDDLKTLPAEVIEKRLYGTRKETEEMMRKIEDERR